MKLMPPSCRTYNKQRGKPVYWLGSDLAGLTGLARFYPVWLIFEDFQPKMPKDCDFLLQLFAITFC